MVKDSVTERRYKHDLAEYAAWREQQPRLRRLAGRALDTLEVVMDAGRPEDVEAAGIVLRMGAAAEKLALPDRLTIAMMDDETAAVGLPDHQ